MKYLGVSLWLKHFQLTFRKSLRGKEGLFLAIHNSGWIFFDKLIRAVLGVLVGAWVARYLGPFQFGELAYCIAFIGIFQAVIHCGLDGIVVREIANHPQQANRVLGTTFQLRLLSGFAAWVFAILLYGWTNGFSEPKIWIIALVGAGMVFQAADTVDLWFQGNSQSKRTVLAKIPVYLLSNAIRVVLIVYEAPLMAFAAVITLEAGLTATALYASYRRFPCQQPWQKQLTHAKKLLQESWPYLISSLAIAIYMRIDQIMIQSLLGERELGIYAAIMPITNCWNMIPVAICASVAPMFANKRQMSTEAFSLALAKLFRFMWLLCLIIITVTWGLSGFLVRWLYGASYEQAIPVLNIYVITCIPIFMGVGQGLWLLNERKSYLSLIQTIAGALVCILANRILLPLYGIEGAAIAAILAQITSCFLMNAIFARKLLKLQMGFAVSQSQNKNA